MTTIVFVRHGETDWNRQGRFQGTQDIPLNDEGRRQARRLAEAWDEGGHVLISSPLSRARETAAFLAASLGLPISKIDPLLIEREFGTGAGLTLQERRERFPDGNIPGVESTEAMRSRAQRFLNDVAESYSGRTVIAVSHGGLINAVLAHVTGGLMGSGKTLLGNASVSTVVFDGDEWSADRVGRTFEAEPLGLKE